MTKKFAKFPSKHFLAFNIDYCRSGGYGKGDIPWLRSGGQLYCERYDPVSCVILEQ